MTTLKFRHTQEIRVSVPFGVEASTGKLWIGIGLRLGDGDEQSLSVAEARRLAKVLNAAADRASGIDKQKARRIALGQR